ncbi:MAG: RNA polymerase sigma factor [Longimicrobiales bacterium]
MDERELIGRVLAGDPAAERALYDGHVDRVYRLAYRLAGSDDLAREATQETFIRAFAKLSDFRGDAALGTWLHSITVSSTLNLLRKVKRFRARELDLDAAGAIGTTPFEPQPRLREKLKRALDALPEHYRIVVVMHDLEGYTHEEIGATLGVARGTSKARLSRARAQLREELAEFAGEWVG